MYKQSNYNIEIKKLDEGEFLFFNSFTGAVCVLDSVSMDILNNIITDDTSAYTHDKQERLSALKENGFIVPEDFDEFNWLTVRNRGLRYNMDSNRLRLTVAPTMGCNFKCYYCYESRAEKCKGMSEETISDLIQYVERKLESRTLSLLSISWYGGEPLLEIETIRRISKELIALCEKYNVNYHADILTNGYFLTRDVAIMLHDECKVVAAQIPMDGMSETYSKRKGVRSQAFDQVVKNIHDISDIIEVHIRMNVDKENESEIFELTKHLLVDLELKEKIRIYLAAVKNYENVCNFMGDDCFTSEDYFRCRNKFHEYLYSLGVQRSIMKTIPAPRWISCGLSQVNGLVVDPEGYLYRCAHLIGHKKHSVGHLKTDQVFNEENMRFLNASYDEKCTKCQMFPICMGGCVFERMLNNNEAVCRETVDRLRNDISLAYNYLI